MPKAEEFLKDYEFSCDYCGITIIGLRSIIRHRRECPPGGHPDLKDLLDLYGADIDVSEDAQ